MTQRLLKSRKVLPGSDGMNTEKDGGGKGENTGWYRWTDGGGTDRWCNTGTVEVILLPDGQFSEATALWFIYLSLSTCYV